MRSYPYYRIVGEEDFRVIERNAVGVVRIVDKRSDRFCYRIKLHDSAVPGADPKLAVAVLTQVRHCVIAQAVSPRRKCLKGSLAHIGPEETTAFGADPDIAFLVFQK